MGEFVASAWSNSSRLRTIVRSTVEVEGRSKDEEEKEAKGSIVFPFSYLWCCFARQELLEPFA